LEFLFYDGRQTRFDFGKMSFEIDNLMRTEQIDQKIISQKLLGSIIEQKNLAITDEI
jgi:hypothetical protein